MRGKPVEPESRKQANDPLGDQTCRLNETVVLGDDAIGKRVEAPPDPLDFAAAEEPVEVVRRNPFPDEVLAAEPRLRS